METIGIVLYYPLGYYPLGIPAYNHSSFYPPPPQKKKGFYSRSSVLLYTLRRTIAKQ